jgi:hypothetical protein
MPRRLFTPAQANKTLPLVRKIVADILESGRELRQVAGERDTEANRRHLEELGSRIHDLMAELGQVGCEYKDWSFDAGLVDFPAIIEDKKVFLCWRSDEPSVQWYHEPEAGYLGRKRIPEHLLREEAEVEASG